MTTHLREAIDTYHSLLTDAVAQASHAQLEAQQQRRGLFFGERKICTVLRPRFLTWAQYRFLQNAIHAIMPAFDKAYRAALQDEKIRAQFKLADWEEELVQADPGFKEPSPVSRMDMFFVTDTNTLSITEYNAEVPAANTYNDQLSDIFYSLPVMREFEKQYEALALPGRHHTLHALTDAYRQWGGRDRPRIGILDWKEVPTYSEFVLFKEYFESQGYETVICDPREVEYRNGKLMSGDFHITLVYKRVLATELVERGGMDNPVVRAVRDGAVCMVNPFRCKILHRKTSLAVLSDDMNAHLFSADDLRAIEMYIPWTRLLSERYTTYEGQRIDLVPFLSAHKDDFVLKPSDEYGGKGIVLGWDVSQSEWDSALKAYLADPTIAQKRITIPSEPYPSLVNGQLQTYARMLDTDPYIFYGNYMSSCLTRISTAALLNVTAGGGSTVPTFVIEKRG
jgi:glutathionylspermidine synthase